MISVTNQGATSPCFDRTKLAKDSTQPLDGHHRDPILSCLACASNVSQVYCTVSCHDQSRWYFCFCIMFFGWNTIQQHEKNGFVRKSATQKSNSLSPIILHFMDISHNHHKIPIKWQYHHVSLQNCHFMGISHLQTNPNPRTVVPWKCVTAEKKAG